MLKCFTWIEFNGRFKGREAAPELTTAVTFQYWPQNSRESSVKCCSVKRGQQLLLGTELYDNIELYNTLRNTLSGYNKNVEMKYLFDGNLLKRVGNWCNLCSVIVVLVLLKALCLCKWSVQNVLKHEHGEDEYFCSVLSCLRSRIVAMISHEFWGSDAELSILGIKRNCEFDILIMCTN